MKSVTMYIKPTCPYCQQAHFLLEEKGVVYKAINLLQHPEKRDEMIERSGGRTTVPQIFIGDQHIGGFDDLETLNDRGELDALLAE